MAKVSSGSSGCRAVAMAGQFWTRPPAEERTTGHGSKSPSWSQQELPNVWSNRTLIYRDVKTFLNEIGGDPQEARYWFTAELSAGRFISSICGPGDDSESGFGLSLLQWMDMKLVVVMGLPPEIEEEDSAKTGTESSLARTMMVKHCQALTEALQHNSANVMPFFSSEALLQLQHTQDESIIPLVCPVGRDAAGHSSVLSPIQVTAAISQSLHPLKVIFLNSSGGIRNQNRKKAVYYLILLISVCVCVCVLSHVRIFTLHRYSSLDIDIDRLLALINKSFEKNLREDYIASLKGLNESALAFCCRYSAAAIITTEPVNSGTPYLDKFVVSSSKQGQGTGQILWECIRQDLGKPFWRSRATNRINPWFFKHCDGSFVNGRWISYELVEYAKYLPDSSCSHIATSVGE
uniref:N-acetylglutamate synthase n=1 Tax=Sinocyclocheilus anshuiensis TaxID=1608454 RepID=A0A671SVC6_9TELE